MYGYDSPDELKAAVRDIKQQLYVDLDTRPRFVQLMEESGRVTGVLKPLLLPPVTALPPPLAVTTWNRMPRCQYMRMPRGFQDGPRASVERSSAITRLVDSPEGTYEPYRWSGASGPPAPSTGRP